MRQFFLTIFVLLTLSVCSNACPSKKEANDCFFKTADSNHDNQVSRSELEKSIYPRLGWFTRAAFKIFGGTHLRHSMRLNTELAARVWLILGPSIVGVKIILRSVIHDFCVLF